jgi:peroxiredoxin
MEGNQLSVTKLVCALLGMMLFGLQSASAAAPLPRNSPEFRIEEPSGKTTMLSSFKGKVVVMEFLFVRSQHCIRVAQTLNQLQLELGARGMQAVGVAFDAPNAAVTGGEFLTSMVEALKLVYPVGYADRASVDAFLERSGKELLSIPQIVVIDRAGMLRAATGGQVNPALEEPNALRALVDNLLKEAPPNTKAAR